MTDDRIVQLYWQRDESAIVQTEQKYGKYLTSIACNILQNREDAAEAVNDTYLRAWDAIPPAKPDVLSTYLGKITRRLAIDAYRRLSAQKRRGSEYTLSLEELGECVPAKQKMEDGELASAINSFLRSQPKQKRDIFVQRYFFADPIAEIAARYGFTQGKIKTVLHRMRLHLKTYLQEEGFTV